MWAARASGARGDRRDLSVRSTNRPPVVNRPAALDGGLCAVLRIVPGARIVRAATHTPKFEPRFLRRRGEPAHGPVRRQLAHHARNTDVLGAGQKIEGHIMNGRTISGFGARGPRRWCHATVIRCLAIDRKTNTPPCKSVRLAPLERAQARFPLGGSEVVSAPSEGDDGGQSNPRGLEASLSLVRQTDYLVQPVLYVRDRLATSTDAPDEGSRCVASVRRADRN